MRSNTLDQVRTKLNAIAPAYSTSTPEPTATASVSTYLEVYIH
jgi:hypothetical protein